MKVGEVYTLILEFTPANATNKNVIWSSDNPNSVTVDSAGNIKAVSIGGARVTCKTVDGNKTADCVIYVSPIPFVHPETYPVTYMISTKVGVSRLNISPFYDDRYAPQGFFSIFELDKLFGSDSPFAVTYSYDSNKAEYLVNITNKNTSGKTIIPISQGNISYSESAAYNTVTTRNDALRIGSGNLELNYKVYRYNGAEAVYLNVSQLASLLSARISPYQITELYSAPNPLHVVANDLGLELYKGYDQLIKGNYSENVTVLGTGMQVLLGLTGFDMPADVRDLTYDITHWENTWQHYLDTGSNLLGFLPVLGGILNKADEVAILVKHGDEFAVIGKTTDKALVGLAQWSNAIKPTQEVIENTNIPRSFVITGKMVNGHEVWVHGNATKHMGEFVNHANGSILVEGELMSSFLDTISEILSEVTVGENFFKLNGWEIGINGDTGVIYHALFK